MDLRLEALAHVYPSGVRALQGVDLNVPAGQRVALVGANGSGKTTLLRHLDGLLRPTGGRVLVGGQDAARLRVAGLAARVGLCFAEPDRQLFASSVRAEVEFGPRHLGRSPAERARAVVAALAATNLVEAAEQNPHDLGLSRRRLVALASILAMGTPIVALDEPTAGLDAAARALVQAIVERLGGEGRTVLVASHDMRFVAEACERVVVLREGRVALDADPAAAFAEARWGLLAEAGVEPPEAARLGAELGLGSTPTEEQLLAALRQRAGAAGEDGTTLDPGGFGRDETT